MNDPLLVPLVIGNTYTVSDLYGMICWEGIYKGALTDENCVEEQDLLLFKIKRESGSTGYLWAGVTPEVGISEKGLHISLTAYHYGNTPRSLKHALKVGGERPKWVRA